MPARRVYTFCLVTFAILFATFALGMDSGTVASQDLAEPEVADEYVVLSWNDLGMHCYNRDFQDLAVLPPYNVLWAQVIRVGDPPQLVTNGISVTFAFTDNTYSVGKSNFWDYDQPLFGVDLPANSGLTGNGLSGTMQAKADHFIVDGIPLTEFRDSNPTSPYPYQLATVIAHDAGSGAELARTVTVAPVSTEMHCDNCHHDGGVEDIATGRVETNILTLHDGEEDDGDDDSEVGGGDDEGDSRAAPAMLENLMPQRPVLCASCHASNALGTAGQPGVPNLSRAMHEKHADEVDDSTQGCYSCHPGPSTQCLRDVMSTEHGMGCVDCHGGMEQVAENPNPWLNEPRCDGCHDEGPYDQNNVLYRMSSEHGGVYCAGCHDSPHAIAPSREANDAIKFVGLQGHSGPVDTCTVCHLTMPAEAGPHGIGTVNSAPTFTSIPPTAATAGVTYTYSITTQDADAGDTRTITALLKPAWLAFADHGDGTATLSGKPAIAQLGEHAVTLRVEDAALASATQNYTISVVAARGAVEGLVYFDADEDGQKDAGEAGMAGVTVTLTSQLALRVSSVLPQTHAGAVTGSDGRYEFTELPVGVYTLHVTPPAGYVLSEPYVTQVTVTAGQTVHPPSCALTRTGEQRDLYLPQLAEE